MEIKKEHRGIVIAVLSVMVLIVAIYIIPLFRNPDFFALNAVSLFMIIALSAILWAVVAIYLTLDKIRNNAALNYDNIERLLLDLRDETKYFYKEKRSSVRYEVPMPARFFGKHEGDNMVNVKDISAGGALIKTSERLRPGESIKLGIYLPIFPQPIFVNTKTIWVRAMPEGEDSAQVFEAGLEFTAMSESDREKLIEATNILGKTENKKK